MVAGRPRTISFSKPDMIKLGQEMVQWVVLNQPIHLSQWYTIEKGFIYNQWKAFLQCPEFLPHYEKALKIVGLHYISGESKKIKDNISQRWQRVYFKDLKEEEDETAAYNASLKKEEAQQDAMNLVKLVKMATDGKISQKKKFPNNKKK